MPKSAKRRPSAPHPKNARLIAKQLERRELARYIREVRAVQQLARRLKRDVEKVDETLRSLAVWLSAREWERDSTGEHADTRQPEPANT